MVHYYRTTRDGRIALGKGGGRLAYGARIGASFSGLLTDRGRDHARMRQDVPVRWPTSPIAASWTARSTARSTASRSSPGCGRPDLVCGAGYSGNGVGPTVLGGRILASLALGLDDEWSGCGSSASRHGDAAGAGPLRRRHRGARAVARKERAEDAGRPVAAIDRALAGWRPPGWCRSIGLRADRG